MGTAGGEGGGAEMTDPFDGMKPAMGKVKRSQPKLIGKRKRSELKLHERFKCSQCNNLYSASRFGYKRNGERYKTCPKCRAKRRDYDQTIHLTGGVSYKEALPPEKWSEMRRFLAALATCATVAHKSKVEPDVWQFISTYREVKGRL